MDDKELFDFIEQNSIKENDKENRDYLNAAKWAYLGLVILEAVFIMVKMIVKQNIAENFGATFITFGIFYIISYKKQTKKRDLLYGILSLLLGVLFSVGYIGMILV